MLSKKVGKESLLDLQLFKLRSIALCVSKLIHEHDVELEPLELPKPTPKPKVQGKAKATAKKLPKPSEPATSADPQPALSQPAEPTEPGTAEPAEPTEPAAAEPTEPGHDPGAFHEQQKLCVKLENELEQVEAEAEQENAEAAVVEVPEPVSLDEATQQKFEELAKAEGKFEVWVRGLTIEQKGKIIEMHYAQHEKLPSFRAYLEYVKQREVLQACSKCRWTSCEKCTFSKAQNYVLRHGKLPAWYRLKKDYLLQ